MNLKELQYLMSKTVDPIGVKLLTREIATMQMAAAQEAVKNARPKQDWDRYCTMFNLKPEDFGRRFKIRSQVYEVTGITPSRPKNAIEIKRVYDGKQFRTSASQVQRATA